MNGRYRVWHKKEKRWLTYQVMLQSGRVGEIAQDGSVVCHKDADVAVCFSTNLHDKNGKEIFFGDILATHNDGEDGTDKWTMEDFGLTVCQEREDRLGVSFSNWHPTRDEDSVYDPDKYAEIIGNIYENPDLIRGDK